MWISFHALVVVATVSASPNRTAPPFQSPSQVAAGELLSAAAANASLAATPQLLRHLDSNLTRTALAKDCPALANASAAALLERVLAELRVAELVESVGTGQYQRLNQLMETNFLYNIWEVMIDYPGNSKPSCYKEVKVETKLYHLPPFKSGCPPTNFTEASERMYYISDNFAKLPDGYMFGPISFVFNRSLVDPATFIAPVDTGNWLGCLKQDGERSQAMNCSGWDPPILGSVTDLNHLVLAAYWLQASRSKPAAFPRIDCVSGAATGATRVIGITLPYPYFESNFIASLAYDKAVMYIIVPMYLYFGQPVGDQIRAWASKWGWQLLWTPLIKSWEGIGSFVPGYSTSAPIRLLDPVVATAPHAPKAVNASLPEAHVQLFAAFWGKFLNRTQPTTLTVAEVTAAWGNLTLNASGSAVLRPQSAGDCEAYGRCVGVEVVWQKTLNSSGWTKGNCVCYN